MKDPPEPPSGASLLSPPQRIPSHNIPRKTSKPQRLPRLIIHRNIPRRRHIHIRRQLTQELIKRIRNLDIRKRQRLVIEPRKSIRIEEETHPHPSTPVVRGPCSDGAETWEDVDLVQFDLFAAHVDPSHAAAGQEGEVDPAVLLRADHSRSLERKRQLILPELLRARVEREYRVPQHLTAVHDAVGGNEDAQGQRKPSGHGVVFEFLGAVAEVLQDVAGGLRHPHAALVGVDVVVGEEVAGRVGWGLEDADLLAAGVELEELVADAVAGVALDGVLVVDVVRA